VKANANALTSAAATSSGTIGYFAIYTASSGGTQRTDWTALSAPSGGQPVVAGNTLTVAAGAIGVTLT
jgi:hypothetical protein